ncbi:MAG: molybdopterin molybdotransferase MoeA, partial [Cyanobacteria bacterium J06649_5]
MFSAHDAERLIFTLVTPIAATETVAISEVGSCLGRVLAQPVTSALDFPHWDNSAMDGYAVRAEDVQQVPVTLQVIEEIPAGHRPAKTVMSGQSARILTGAMMPNGADTVVMQENTERSQPGVSPSGAAQPGTVTILNVPEPQNFVRQQGSFSKAGDELLPVGRAIAPAEVALLAAAQCPTVQVYRRPRVAILSTGCELVSPEQPLG